MLIRLIPAETIRDAGGSMQSKPGHNGTIDSTPCQIPLPPCLPLGHPLLLLLLLLFSCFNNWAPGIEIHRLGVSESASSSSSASSLGSSHSSPVTSSLLPASHPPYLPASHPASHPASLPPCLPASHPASHPASLPPCLHQMTTIESNMSTLVPSSGTTGGGDNSSNGTRFYLEPISVPLFKQTSQTRPAPLH